MKFLRTLCFWLLLWIGCTVLVICITNIYNVLTDDTITIKRQFPEPPHSRPFPERPLAEGEPNDTGRAYEITYGTRN